MPDTIDVPGYLTRLGLPELAGHRPSAEALDRLHRAHAERVPYECLEIQLGRPTTVCPAESLRRVVAGRGGYCFHLNGAFSALLRALGYTVTRHVGGVQGRPEDPAGANASHLVLTVTGLPSAAAPDGEWLVDLGMGDGLHGPLPLVAGEYRQGPFRYTLRPSDVEPGGWRFDHDPSGTFHGMDFRSEPARMSEFAAKHEELSTSPESGFVRVPAVLRRDATGVDILRGSTLKRVGADPSRAELTTPGAYFEALSGVFGLTFSAADRETLWRRVSEAERPDRDGAAPRVSP
ncbi:arylamine N-acetyltransferase family protein [Actinoplanes utahensis]|uniref:arylamine N-acetyltransferase family protein n=1 Tax=Actinoplanes utahensis TaxID=1869 RepID=UPI00068CD16E|nr:arylamine N-acetyltransferase [Actinoplanes utahensis]GIF30227.1 arylamine N-acetyltransferase [Actinoplanes utahensis]